MHVTQCHWIPDAGWRPGPPVAGPADLVLLFGAPDLLRSPELAAALRTAHPTAHFLGCSTSGEICATRVHDGTLVATAIRFDHTSVRMARVDLKDAADSQAAGARLAAMLPPEVPSRDSTDGAPAPLAHVLVLSEGIHVNGSDLVRGMAAHLPAGAAITGGLAGDGDRFEATSVLCDTQPAPHAVGAVGFYGRRLRVGCASLGGWDPFGPERLITRAEGNVLYELDGRSALALYRQYLGEHASGLPATGLLFPLSLRLRGGSTVVRSILGIDEAAGSLTFAGDVPVGSYARLMKANFDRLIDGAVHAAQATRTAIGTLPVDFALLVSCVGRKMILGQRIEEEVEGVREILGPQAVLAGFYSYGEISPFTPGAKCELHNQTMAITTFTEV